MKKIISAILTFVLILSLAKIPFANVYRSGDEEKIETKFYSVIEQAKAGNYEVLLDNIDLRFDTFYDSVSLIKDYIGNIEIVDDVIGSGKSLSKMKQSFFGNIMKDEYSATTKITFKPFNFILKKVDKINDDEYAVLLEINMPEKKYYEDMEIEYEKMKKKSGLGVVLDLNKIVPDFMGLGFLGDKMDTAEYILKSSLVDYENYNIQTVTRTIKIYKLDNNYKMVLNLNEYLDHSISDGYRNSFDISMLYQILGKIKYNGNDENDLALVNYLLKPMINMLREQIEVK